MTIYKPILALSFILGSLDISGCNLHTQQEFEKICLSGGHTKTSCDCIYQRLEQAYSPKLMQRLEHVSLQSPVLPQDFAPTFFSVMQRCDKSSMG
ncbi:hypothetical protein MWMV17_MWMV17_03201 [Acinetobacter calcoaceticus]|uniref:Uncharacterized protein n=1 Tax=Acinetobacter calcoaceticus DSM 30006 = CIP 81.8 TaxID=981331 RepID=A0ABN0K3S4_ACICA|nr:hypothetical protein [Acinetobacter calcoaceticus]ENV97760.1 hypothetical protein F936_03412 [Acinetobacter calcoaceticus DSM 30006 = CIP 81.8]CAI3159302.1 hypothetical protein MWMV17_MWMV17_03201 [Acinetobacter calcoaceticus]SUU51721.1 Uncharacterised protein [Acinetobacter calcoaceticus]